MDLTNYMLIDISTGTVLTAETCRLVHDSDLSSSEWEELDTMSDNETGELARERGRRITLDDQLVESIAEALWGDGADTEWNSDTLDAIANAIRALRPDLARN
jgi:hypothetical protein